MNPKHFGQTPNWLIAAGVAAATVLSPMVAQAGKKTKSPPIMATTLEVDKKHEVSQYLFEVLLKLAQEKNDPEAQLSVLKSIHSETNAKSKLFTTPDLREFHNQAKSTLHPYLLGILGVEQFIRKSLLDDIEIPKKPKHFMVAIEKIYGLALAKPENSLTNAWWATLLARNIMTMQPNLIPNNITPELVNTNVNIVMRARGEIVNLPIISGENNIVFVGNYYTDKSGSEYFPLALGDAITKKMAPTSKSRRGNLDLIISSPFLTSTPENLSKRLEQSMITAPVGFSLYLISHMAAKGMNHEAGILLSSPEAYREDLPANKGSHILSNKKLVEIWQKRYKENPNLIKEEVVNRPKIILSTCNQKNADWVNDFFNAWSKVMPDILPPIIVAEATEGTTVPVQNKINSNIYDPMHSRFASIMLNSANFSEFINTKNWLHLQEVSKPDIFVPLVIKGKWHPIQVM